jgi:ribonuclease H / adenosylcobalamin/alpha-ribazole phosphatase
VTGRSVVVEADGGSRGNPGPAGYGALVRDAATGEVLTEVAAGIGTASNNVAEYRGLLAGLQAALDLGAGAVEVRMDSKLVIEQMSGRWKVKHPDMQALASQAAALVRQLSDVSFTHVPRARNVDADRLANQAMDDQRDGRDWRPRGSGDMSDVLDVPPAAPVHQNSLYGWSRPVGTPTVAMLLRHGETPLSVDKRFSGRGDAALTDRGVAQAEAAARRLAAVKVDAVVSSPLRRARQTAGIVAEALGLEVELDDGLAESDFGEWEGLSFAEVSERDPGALAAWLGDPRIAPPGGESMESTGIRVKAARERMMAAHPDATVVAVSHVTPIKLLLRDALAAPIDAVFRIHLEPASLSVVDWYPASHPVVRLVNDAGHLGALTTDARR